MASKGSSSEKWKRKAMYEARAAKKVCLDVEERVVDRPRSEGEDHGVSDDEGSKDRAQLSDSENDRSSESSDNESDELTDEKAQVIFDDWMISLSISQKNSSCPPIPLF